MDTSSRGPNPVDVHVGSRVRLRRMLLGMSQERLGEQLGLTFQQIQKYEKGSNRIGASRLYQIATILSVPISYFYDELELPAAGSDAVPGFAEEGSQEQLMSFLSTREGLELNRAFARIESPKVRRGIVELVRNLADDEEE